MPRVKPAYEAVFLCRTQRGQSDVSWTGRSLIFKEVETFRDIFQKWAESGESFAQHGFGLATRDQICSADQNNIPWEAAATSVNLIFFTPLSQYIF